MSARARRPARRHTGGALVESGFSTQYQSIVYGKIDALKQNLYVSIQWIDVEWG